MYQKRPTKQELYERIAALEAAQQREYEKRNREKLKRWEEQLPAAFTECRRQLTTIFPRLLTLLHFEHVDDGGYWFTFQLINDERRQTHCIRHYEMENDEQ